jgi:predicted nucleic acid-binding Zn ribbon protein
VTKRTDGRADGRKRQPVRLGDALKEYTANAGLARRIDLARAVEDWPERVGSQVAAVTRAESVTPDGILRVRVPSAAWANELSLMAPRILAKLNEGRRGKIRELRFITGGF